MSSRTRVLSAFKEIHRTCQSVFAGDRQALKVSRWKINTEFKRFKDEDSSKKVEDHIQWARDSSRLLKLTAVQGKPRNRALYEKYLEEKMRNEDRRTSYRKSYSDHGGQPQYRTHGSRRPHNYDTAWDDDYSTGHPARHHSKKKWRSHSYNYHDHHDDHLFDDEFYEDDRMKQQQRRKPRNRNVDSANFDLWQITGKRR